MPFKVNIGTKDGKTFKIETELETLVGKKIGEKISGEDVSSGLGDYEFEIMGTSDIAGFPGTKEREGANALSKYLKQAKNKQLPKGRKA